MPDWGWGESQSEDGVVHQNTANTDHDDATELKQGYDYANFSEITPDPTACWPLHEDSGSTVHGVAGGNDGTINGATIGVAGILGTSAYDFDGTDDRLVVPNSTDLQFSDGITISAWVYWGGGGSANGRVLTKRTDNSTLEAYSFARDQFIDADNSLAFRLNLDGTIHNVDSPSPMPQETWVHWVGTWDGSTQKIYKNGSEVNSQSLFGTIDQNTDSLGIGARGDGGADFWDGRLADLRLYDTALSASQIQALYDVVTGTGTWTGTAKTL